MEFWFSSLWYYGGTAGDEVYTLCLQFYWTHESIFLKHVANYLQPNMDKSKLDTRVLQRTVMQLHHQVLYRFCKLFADIFESSTDIAVHNGIYKKEL